MLHLYICSTLVHALPAGKAKNIFEILDHSAIYFFIAGSYTPYLFIVIKGWECWTLFGVVWGLAIIGTVFKCFFVKNNLQKSIVAKAFFLAGQQVCKDKDVEHLRNY